MSHRSRRRLTTLTLGLAIFTLGYVCGSLTTPQASAQLPQIPGGLTPSGGPLGAAVQLGSSIKEMEQHVSGLQKNLDTLRKVQSALGGK
jgi:hypothetical protein